MTITNRWFIEKKFLEGDWTDYPFNPESGYETKAQAEQYTSHQTKPEKNWKTWRNSNNENT